MIAALALLFACQLLGEVAVKALGLPIPGPVVGMALLLVGLMIRKGQPPEALTKTGKALVDNLSLLFVPVGVGVIAHIGLLSQEAAPAAISLVLSTVIGLFTAGLLMHGASKAARKAGKDKGGDHDGPR